MKSSVKFGIQVVPFLLIIQVFLLITGCKKSTVYSPVAPNAIHIGALLSISGTGYSNGESSKVSLELARQDIEAYLRESGIDMKVIVVMADTKTDTAEALKQLQKLFDQGIRMVIGPYSSAEVAALKPFVDAHGMILVSPSSVAASLAIAGDNVFRFVSSDILQGKAMSKMLTEDNMKVMVPVIRNDVWGNDLLNATKADFIQQGGIVHDPVKFDPKTTDFTDFLTLLEANVNEEISQHNPNEVAVYMLSFAEGGQLLRQASGFPGLNSIYWYGSSAFAQNASLLNDTVAALFAYTHGLPCPVFGLDETFRDKWQPLQERIRSRIGRNPDVYAFTAYDALWVGVLSQITAGPYCTFEQLKTAFIHQADQFSGTSGNTTLDVNGDRAIGNYDFWAVKCELGGYYWKRVAQYNSATGMIIRINEKPR